MMEAGQGALREPNQEKPSQSKENQTKKGLDFFGFSRPNRDFSMGYGPPPRKTSCEPGAGYAGPPCGTPGGRAAPSRSLHRDASGCRSPIDEFPRTIADSVSA